MSDDSDSLRMPRRRVLATAVALAAPAAASVLFVSRASRAAPKKTMPPKIAISLSGAAIRPAKADETPWDGTTKLSPQQAEALQKSLAKLAVEATSKGGLVGASVGVGAALGALFAEPLFAALAKPDVFGIAELAPQGVFGEGKSTRLKIASREKPVREFRPEFGDSVTFADVPYHKDLKVKVMLTDADLVNDDQIGTVVLDAEQVAAAYQDGKAFTIYVGKQGAEQILALVLIVSKGG